MTVIHLDQVRFRWPDQTEDILSIESFSLLQNEKVFLQGPSGSGKSTLLSLMAGIHQPLQGDIWLRGESFSTLSAAKRDRRRADHIGYIFQQFNLLPYLSVIENVLLPCRFSPLRKEKTANPEQEARRLLKALQLPEACLSRQVTQLSIGQQQRVAAARALIGRPALLIADEPTSALDHDNRNHFIKLLMDECELAGASLLFVSHDPTLTHGFDRTLNLAALNRSQWGECA
ncbi:ABC transporter ATP-binding protein [Photobacterium galatheae]|uniref:Methionine ABC transporter ATP-binding protein n=1 Tax=Photobacterium galatheae TaxID=1654360 RepID=A0A066RTV4_9GAMM|nr:ABC transporter ATP-binding protein [Photobacterium galatheae]KDM92546.1 methionine ABC transporter ATP-binding protein [Photobacterium galatheae]MCM0148023.1 ABC transporter ATP-binding protein [Photobacterium galatheae]